MPEMTYLWRILKYAGVLSKLMPPCLGEINGRYIRLTNDEACM